MNKSEEDRQRREAEDAFTRRIGNRAERKQHARNNADRALWHGLGAMGTVGWTVGLPTLIGVLLGIWIDALWLTSPVSWTLVLMIGGLLFGVGSAWLWLEGERKEIEREGFRQEHSQEENHHER